jgi:hypothetical protein
MEYSCDEMSYFACEMSYCASDYLIQKILKRYKRAGPGLSRQFDEIIAKQSQGVLYYRTLSIAQIKQGYEWLKLLGIERQSKSPRAFFMTSENVVTGINPGINPDINPSINPDINPGINGLYLPLTKKCDVYIYETKGNIYIIGQTYCINVTSWIA